MELRPDLVIADRFRLVRPLGHGGMGAVWLAHHITLQVPCALKFMHAAVATDPSLRARFDREAVAAAQLRSPHVVQVLDHGVWEGSPYIAMEYLEGEDLEQRLRRRKTLSPEETAAIVAQVARALTKAHAAGLVHRDLKPANIFLTKDDDREIAKVLDFGVAKSSTPTASGQTKTGAIMGTPYYMSPEQAQGTKAVDHRTDLWALGVLVYECLTGALPFVSDAFGDLVLKIIVEPIPVPSQIGPVPAGFDAWWARAVDRDPANRFQSAKELADALEAALGVQPSGAIGTPSMLAGADAPEGDGTHRRTSTPPRQGVVSAATGPEARPGTMAAAVATVPPVRERSRALAFVASFALVALGGVLFFLRGHGDAGASAAQAARPSAETIAAPAPPPPAPAPVATVEPASATLVAGTTTPPPPPASASAPPAREAGAPSPSPATSASAKPAAPAPRHAAQHGSPSSSSGHDIGF